MVTTTGTQIITGGAGSDTISSTLTAGVGATITGGAGADVVTYGTGLQKYFWTATTAAGLATETGSTAGVAVTAASGTVGDFISGFLSGAGADSDILNFSQTLTNPSGTDTDTLKVISKTGTIADTDRFVFVDNAAVGDAVNTTAGAVTVLTALITTAVIIGASTIVAMDNDTNVYLWLIKQVSAADTIAAQDITLIGVLTGITVVANSDFVSFA